MKVLIPAVLCCAVLYGAGAAAQSQSGQSKGLQVPQAERRAIELRQGMTVQEVEKLLGKPRRTALKAEGYAGARDASPGTLHWTYAWAGGPQPDRLLQVVFATKGTEGWLVSSWDWAGY
jgi:hypothetical protein